MSDGESSADVLLTLPGFAEESKIDLTDRLRSEKRWASASLFKDRRIKQMVSEGVSRREARDRAWTEMAAKFPPLDGRYVQMNELLVMADFAPRLQCEIAEADDEPAFDAVWRLWLLTIARVVQWEAGDFEAAAFVTSRMRDGVDIDSERAIAEVAVATVEMFVSNLARPKFQAVLERLENIDRHDETYSDELRSHLRVMEAFQHGASLEGCV